LEPINGLPYLEIITQEKFLARAIHMDESRVMLSIVSYHRMYETYIVLTETQTNKQHSFTGGVDVLYFGSSFLLSRLLDI